MDKTFYPEPRSKINTFNTHVINAILPDLQMLKKKCSTVERYMVGQKYTQLVDETSYMLCYVYRKQ
jgi:hypothetical protein